LTAHADQQRARRLIQLLQQRGDAPVFIRRGIEDQLLVITVDTAVAGQLPGQCRQHLFGQGVLQRDGVKAAFLGDGSGGVTQQPQR
jgi:hypothetical protein